jgi:hypothetical protein
VPSVSFVVGHPTNEIAGGLGLHWHGVRQRTQRLDVYSLAWPLNGRELREGPASARNLNRFSFGDPRKQLTQMRLRLGNAYALQGLPADHLVVK